VNFNENKTVVPTKKGGKKQIPQIKLIGDWLQDYNFSIGSRVIVECGNGVISIKLRNSNPNRQIEANEKKVDS